MFLPDRVIDHLRKVSDEPDLTGTKYRLVELVGRGGMGEVYRAEDVELGREVALKVATLHGAGGLAERLQNEARVLAGLEHPGIVPIHDVGVLPDGRVFYAMKLVRGERLDVWARAADRPSVLRLFQRICEAVAFAHAHGVIHRDLKPDNVMVGEFGEALVMDWGLAKSVRAVAASGAARAAAVVHDETELEGATLPMAGQTAAGTVMGTPAFMPPEQARGDTSAIDRRSDVWGLGAILYTLLAGRPPYVAESGALLLARAATGAPDPLARLAVRVPPPLASICAKAMAADPAARYPSALELGRDIEAFLDQAPVSAHRDGVLERAARFASRHRVVLSLFAVYLLVRAVLAVAARW